MSLDSLTFAAISSYLVQPRLRTILIVDNNPDDIFFARRALAFTQIKNPIVSINSGEEAIAYLQHAPKPAPCLAFVI